MQQRVHIFWFRRDLRVVDNAGLFQALSSGLPVVPVYIFPGAFDEDAASRRRMNFITGALDHLQEQLIAAGSRLHVYEGSVPGAFEKILQDWNVHTVVTNHDYDPFSRRDDRQLHELLAAKGIEFRTFKDHVIFEKSEVVKEDGQPYSVFTPYARKWKGRLTETGVGGYPSEKLLHRLQPTAGIPAEHMATSQGMLNKRSVPHLSAEFFSSYEKVRDYPSRNGTSRLSVHLRYGTVSIRQVATQAMAHSPVFLNELIWREFFMQVLWHHPRVVQESFRREYDNIRWRNNETEFERWCLGNTGFPLVDAGMRELRETGFMHNRVRMITASFLVKDLLIDWRRGEAWFAQQLLDFEIASNNGNWQWAAGCGCDAAPYFRIFHPDRQLKKFDPELEYVRTWIPEIEEGYVAPMVDHDVARERCLEVYREVKCKM